MPFIPINTILEQLISIVLNDLSNNRLEYSIYYYINNLVFKKQRNRINDFIYDIQENNTENNENPNISLRFFNTFFNIMLYEKTEDYSIYNFYIEDDLENQDIINLNFNVKIINKTRESIQIYDFIPEKKNEYCIVRPRKFYNELIIEIYNNMHNLCTIPYD